MVELADKSYPRAAPHQESLGCSNIKLQRFQINHFLLTAVNTFSVPPKFFGYFFICRSLSCGRKMLSAEFFSRSLGWFGGKVADCDRKGSLMLFLGHSVNWRRIIRKRCCDDDREKMQQLRIDSKGDCYHHVSWLRCNHAWLSEISGEFE